MLEIKDLKVAVEDTKILNGVSLNVPEGSIQIVMGPNGSGKSSLAYTLMGHPHYEVTAGSISLNGKDITSETPDKRSLAGLYLAMQSPMAIEGLQVKSFLWQLYQKHRIEDEEFMDLSQFQRFMRVTASKLHLDVRLLDRSLNDGFSGGERKKLEIMQMLVVKPKLAIIDEIDSGLDVDALKAIADVLQTEAREHGLSLLVITHYPRLLEYLKPDNITVLRDGLVAKTGGMELVEKIEASGYKSI
ncbi:Fe-S cluster assembly ATPase SufC [Candidatus Saccharibacteria bacterium]|jgi:Fe-S cluster assembly ATP-binding protein|nr:Fe-S cluster assembly ATPase SufC [Candidatus Saccharibacteria bacterium]MBP9131969.1 Fe-S cluster assembly ATPase SufC [Candidatus Saccharibacteria bacterium]